MLRRPALPYLTLCLTASLANAALAQAPGGTGRTLEIVEVSAQKVSENLQNVPISISVASARDINNVNAFDFKDLQEITPGVTFGGGAGLQSAAIRIRGVGPAFFALGTPPNVAVFVDEVAQAQIGAVFSTMVDIERVELLRGPQGTLYGRNAPGGAYNISTRKPNFDGVNGYVEGSLSSFESKDLLTQDLRAAVNVPLVEDTLALRLAAVYSESDGFVKMVNPEATADTTGGKDNQALRAKLLWEPSEAVSLMWTSNYQDLEQNPPGFNYDGLVPGTGGTATSPVPAIYNDFGDNRNHGTRRSIVTGDIKDTSLHLTWDTDAFVVDALAFYQQFETFSDEDREPYPGGVSKFQIQADTDITTLELRISDTGDVLDYVAGLYYFSSDAITANEIRIQGVDVLGDADLNTEGYAVFANANFHLSPQWDLAAGLRFDDTQDTLTSSTVFTGINAALDDQKLTFDEMSWSFKLRNYINDNLTAYLAIDHAFKQGGFNALVAGVGGVSEAFNLPIPAVVAQAAAATLTYDAEESDAIELGIKGDFLDGRLRVGAAIFYQRYEDHHVAQTEQFVEALGSIYGNFFIAALTNAEEIETQGIEMDATYLIGDHWEVATRIAYAEPSVGEWSSRFCPTGENTAPDQLLCPLDSGNSLNNLAEWNTNTQIGYERPLHGAWELYTRASWTWQSAPPDTRLTNDFSESRNTLGLTLGVREANLGLDIKAWVKNLTDEHRNVDPGRKPNGDSDLADAWQGSFTPGRELGVTVNYSF